MTIVFAWLVYPVWRTLRPFGSFEQPLDRIALNFAFRSAQKALEAQQARKSSRRAFSCAKILHGSGRHCGALLRPAHSKRAFLCKIKGTSRSARFPREFLEGLRSCSSICARWKPPFISRVCAATSWGYKSRKSLTVCSVLWKIICPTANAKRQGKSWMGE